MKHDDPIPNKTKEKNWLKSARVKAQNQDQKTLEIIMTLTILKLMKQNIIYMNLNDYFHKEG